jgi:hypothetical protein
MRSCVLLSSFTECQIPIELGLGKDKHTQRILIGEIERTSDTNISIYGASNMK